MSPTLRTRLTTIGLALLTTLCACTAPALGPALGLQEVTPWQKGNLALPEMTFESNPLAVRYNEHIYTSREAASGGAGVGGGGCGCN